MNLSEPRLISPMLDGFVMGDPISNHDGVRACPAMHLETDKKYIVKIISLPATQSKLDALLLAGAFTDRQAALDYFKELADGVMDEAALLQKLSKNEGFVSFDEYQLLDMEDGETGFDIYLLGQYRPTLESVFRANEMTHLQAINLGLDLCTALSLARRDGFLYCNLKPSNVYVCNDREFRIGDLGFLSLDSLSYASLPDKYHSDYTPLEISDAYSALNSTMDTYAVGLILYQAYNEGRLPVVGMSMDAPRHADPVLAQIILRACAADPAERWQDPAQMGQALATYMQEHTVNDTPIVPPVAEEVEPEPVEEIPAEDAEPSTDDILAEVDEALDNAPPIVPAAEPVAEAVVEEEVVEEVAEAVEEIPAEDAEPVEEVVIEEVSEEITEEAPVEEETSEEEEVLDETAQMLAQADDLIAHQLPDPPVAPDPIEVTLPDPEEITLEIPEEEEEVATVEEVPDEEEIEESNTEEEEIDEEYDENDEEYEPAEPKKKSNALKVWAIVLSAVLLLTIGSFLFIRYFYLQTIDDLILSGDEDRLTVTLVTETKDELLSVLCTDTHGNTITAEVKDGVAEFTGLKSGTWYTVEVRIKGFHKLLGETGENYTTETQTVINGFYAATGTENGSVILSFTPQGPTSAQWTVTYSADGEETKELTFNGHMVTLNGLAVNKEYTFTLKPVEDLYLSGTDTITYTITQLVYAEDVKVLGYEDGKLIINWNCPEDATVPLWYVRCYNDAGFDKTMTTTEPSIAFEGLDKTAGYTIEVTAEGMTLGVRTSVSANTITVSDIKADISNLNSLKITWKHDGDAPIGGWMLLYSVDGNAEQKIMCSENSCTITPLIPGTKYSITIAPADGSSVFGGEFEYDAPAAPGFNGFLITNKNIEVSMCKTPKKTNWTRKDVSEYTTTFKVGTSASFVMHVDTKTSQPKDEVVTLYVIRDTDGNLISANRESRTWDDMWDDRYAEFNIPVMPANAGSYTVEIYFNGMAVTTQSFEITA